MFEAAQTKTKPYPLGTFTHIPIALIIDLVKRESFTLTETESITVEMPTLGAAMFSCADGDGHPVSSADAQFNMPFAAALAVTYRNAGL